MRLDIEVFVAGLWNYSFIGYILLDCYGVSFTILSSKQCDSVLVLFDFVHRCGRDLLSFRFGIMILVAIFAFESYEIELDCSAWNNGEYQIRRINS